MASVLITGASKGIGRATALYLDKKGYKVFAGVRTLADGEALCKEASPQLQPVLLDVTDSRQIVQMAETIQRTVGTSGLYGLVNNAGVAVPAPLEYMPIDEFRRQIEVNLTGQLAVTQALLPAIRQAQGRIINISSVGGRIAAKMLGAYHASKFALEALADTLRQELAPWNIQVINIQPGGIATPIWETGSVTADRLLEAVPAEAQTAYGTIIAASRSWAKSAASHGLPPERVATVIYDALSAVKPRTRYTVGTDAWIGVHILANLPDRLRDRLLSRR